MTVLGKPSASLPDRLEVEEKSRIAAQRAQLGEEGLARAVKLLEEAKKEHERPIPPEMLTDFKVPSLSSISWIPTQSAWNRVTDTPSRVAGSSENDLQKHLAQDPTVLPFFMEFDHVKVQ